MSATAGRRKFFAMLGAGSIAAAAAALTASAARRKAVSDRDARRQGSGYRETEHVRRYYRTARS